MIGGLFLVLSLIYNVTVPLWESDNEWSHYSYARYIVINRELPAPDSQIAITFINDQCLNEVQQEFTTVHQFRQPPLYYLLGALTISWIDIDVELPYVTNPHVYAPRGAAGTNIAIHSPAEDFPYQGTVLAVHVLRLLSTLIGLSGLVAVYLTGLLLFPRRRYLALAALAVTAFVPQYVFSSSVINNDILVGALGFWCVYLCIYVILRGFKPLALLAAIAAAGLAVLAKYTALPLIPVVIAALAISFFRAWRRDGQSLPKLLGQVALLAVAGSLPALLWLIRNKLLFGQFFLGYSGLLSALLLEPGRFLVAGDSPQLLDPLRAGEFAFMTFWGLFGNDLLALPASILTILAAISGVALFGVILFLLDKQQPRYLRILTLLAIFFVLEAWALSAIKAAGTSEPRGRYLMPIFSTVSFLLVIGLYHLLPARLKVPGLAAVSVGLFVLALSVPFFLLQPAYAAPPLQASVDLLPEEEPAHATFGDFAELIGYRVETDRVGLFEPIDVILVWRSLQKTDNNYTVGVHILDGANVSHGTLTSYPGRGNFATSLWQPGDVFRDPYRLYLEPSARDYLPSLGRIKVALYCYHPDDTEHLPVSDQEGNAIGDAVYLGRLKLVDRDVEPASPASTGLLAQFGDQIGLESVALTPDLQPRPGETMTITLQWQALARPAADYTLFAHLQNAQGEQIAGNDQPLTGGYYPSGLWDAGESVRYVHHLSLPRVLDQGRYDLVIGLYDPQTGERLPVSQAGASKKPNGELLLGSWELAYHYHFLPGILASPARQD